MWAYLPTAAELSEILRMCEAAKGTKLGQIVAYAVDFTISSGPEDCPELT